MLTLPALDAETDAALRRSIEEFGVIVPVIYNRGELLDGHNRTRIAAELGVEVQRVDLDLDPGQAELVGVEVNTARRQLTTAKRRQIVKSLIEAGHSQRATAAAVGVSKRTVQNDIDQVDTSIHVPDRIQGQDGKSYPSVKDNKTTLNAKAEMGRVHKGLATIEGTCFALGELKFDRVLLVATGEDLAAWESQITGAISSLNKLRKKLRREG